VQQVGELAEAEGHHPDVRFGWGYATVSLQTKKIKGLHENDFIMAAKIDRLAQKPNGWGDDTHSRYIESTIKGCLICCLYIPDGNPAPGPKFDYKLRWFYASELLALHAPAILAGDYNVMPTELDVYKPERWVDDALFRLEVRSAFHKLIAQGWTDGLRKLHPDERIYTFWDYFRNAFGRDAGLRINHLLLSPSIAARLVAANVDRHARGWEKASDHAPVWIELSEERLSPSRRKRAR
jgi:exodeoxyribonuclease-3